MAADIKLQMSSDTVIEDGRQFTTKRPTLEMTEDLTIGDLISVLSWMTRNGIPSSSYVKVVKKKGKFYIQSAHTTSEQMPRVEITDLIA